MQLKVQHVRTAAVDYRLVEIAGRMHYDDVPRFRQAIVPWLRAGHNTVLDCTKLVFVCAAGTRVLLDAAAAAVKPPAAGCRAAGFQPHILADMQATGLHRLLDIRPTLQEALADLAGPDAPGTRQRPGMPIDRFAPAPPTRWGAAVRDLMRERGMTQKELAAAADVRPNTVTDIVHHGKPATTTTLFKLAAALDVDVAELMMTPGQRADWRERQQDGLGVS